MEDILILGIRSLTRERNAGWRKCYKHASVYLGNDLGRICTQYGFGEESEIPEQFMDVTGIFIPYMTTSIRSVDPNGMTCECIIDLVGFTNWVLTGNDEQFKRDVDYDYDGMKQIRTNFLVRAGLHGRNSTY